jgi:hypothetical protein
VEDNCTVVHHTVSFHSARQPGPPRSKPRRELCLPSTSPATSLAFFIIPSMAGQLTLLRSTPCFSNTRSAHGAHGYAFLPDDARSLPSAGECGLPDHLRQSLQNLLFCVVVSRRVWTKRSSIVSISWKRSPWLIASFFERLVSSDRSRAHPAVCFNHAPVHLTGTNSYLIRFVIAAGC